ncbi:helix-turn-helix domain-containing protein [Prauserella cavernicola]|uniref:AraC family transcriptional regulator n=1 Tax=Prauserella cavernicola TaxID=2800127 RepID=A0A934R0C4_9PSEU|nr:helix-turn-helix domain-containing protein [Prauserella cavernicola]MBK1788528.1 AraC family transcriptional regulator [Prauserella cavernicola]
MYRETAAPAGLRGIVRCLWESRLGGPKRIVPDGCADLMVAGERVFVAGPDTGPWDSDLPEGTVVHGIRFRPGQAPRALGMAAAELTNQRVALADLWGSRGANATEQLLHRPAALAEVVAGVADPRRDPELELLLHRLDAGAPRVSDALDGLGVGERQLRRRFTLAVGYGPATYLRVARLRRAIALAGSSGDLASLAAAAGYADQAHLSRDCRELTGSTPGAYFALSRAA